MVLVSLLTGLPVPEKVSEAKGAITVTTLRHGSSSSFLTDCPCGVCVMQVAVLGTCGMHGYLTVMYSDSNQDLWEVR